MKRSAAKKQQKTVEEQHPFLNSDESAFLNIMQDTLSPYWSARMEYTRKDSETKDSEAL